MAVLTRRGVRIGVYADVAFKGPPLPVPGPLRFIRCGQVETWELEKGEFRLSGLRIWLLDGEQGPHLVLPRNQYDLLPGWAEIQEFVPHPVECPTFS